MSCGHVYASQAWRKPDGHAVIVTQRLSSTVNDGGIRCCEEGMFPS